MLEAFKRRYAQLRDFVLFLLDGIFECFTLFSALLERQMMELQVHQARVFLKLLDCFSLSPRVLLYSLYFKLLPSYFFFDI